MSFSEWDNQRVQLEIYLKEHYVLLSRGRVWSALVTFGVAFAIALIGIYTLQAVRHDNALSALAAELRAEQAPTDSIDVDRTLAELASLRDEQARLRSDLKALPPPVVVEAPTDERPNADLASAAITALQKALEEELETLRSRTQTVSRGLAKVKEQLDAGRFETIVANEIHVGADSSPEYIRMVAGDGGALLQLSAQNRAAVLRVKKDAHALLDFKTYTNGWEPVVHVGTDANANGTAVTGLVAMDNAGRKRMRLVYEAETDSPLVDLVDSQGYSGMMARLSNDQPEIDFFDGNRIRIETGVLNNGDFGMTVYDPDGTAHPMEIVTR